MTTPAKIITGQDLKKYEEMDVDTLLSQLSPEEISILAKEVDPDVSHYLLFLFTRECANEFYQIIKQNFERFVIHKVYLF